MGRCWSAGVRQRADAVPGAGDRLGPRPDGKRRTCKSSRYRRIYIGDELERLHSEYVWQMCDAGAHMEVDLASHFVLVNLRRGRCLAPMRPETVYDKVRP
jgi:hypothetical protein